MISSVKPAQEKRAEYPIISLGDVGSTSLNDAGPFLTSIDASTVHVMNWNVSGIVSDSAPPSAKLTLRGRIIHTKEETRQIDFPYPPEPDL